MNITKNIDQDIFETLVRWLMTEYSEEDARDQLLKAKIVWESNEITIIYENSVVDKVKVESVTTYKITPIYNSKKS
jgi:hypothetical protein